MTEAERQALYDTRREARVGLDPIFYDDDPEDEDIDRPLTEEQKVAQALAEWADGYGDTQTTAELQARDLLFVEVNGHTPALTPRAVQTLAVGHTETDEDLAAALIEIADLQAQLEA